VAVGTVGRQVVRLMGPERKVVALIAATAAVIGFSVGPAYAADYDVAFITGNDANDGLLLGSINKNSGSLCYAVTQRFHPEIIINGLVDCNADGQNVAAFVSYFPGAVLIYWRCEGTYFGGWDPETCFGDYYTPPA
jgi:hypothetical protein